MGISHAGSRGFDPREDNPNDNADLSELYRAIWSSLSAEQLADQFLSREKIDFLTLATNNKCNLACPHCYLLTDTRPDPIDDDGRQRIVDFGLLNFGVRTVCFVGREPLLDPSALVSAIRLKENEQATNIGLITNGTLINRWLSSLESGCIDFLDVSLDGPRDIHDNIRGSGTFSRILRNVDKLSARMRGRTSVLMTLQSANYHSPGALMRSLTGFGIRQVVFGFYSPNSLTDETLSINLDEFRISLDAIVDSVTHEEGPDVLLDIDFTTPSVLAEVNRRGWLCPQDLMVDKAGDTIFPVLTETRRKLFLRAGLVSSNLWHSLRVTADGLILASDDGLDPSTYDSVALAGLEDVEVMAERVKEAKTSARMGQQLMNSLVTSRNALGVKAKTYVAA